MKLITTTALALVAATIAAPASAQYGATAQQPRQNATNAQQQAAPAATAQPQIKPSGKALKALVDLQTTVNNKDYANVPAKVAAAKAVASTKEDRYLIGQLELKAAVGTNDNAAIASAIDAIANSGYGDAATNAKLYTSLGSTLYNNKQYPQAAAAFQKAVAMDPNNSEAGMLLGEAYFAEGQKAQAAAQFQKAIQARVAAGQKPDEPLIKRAVAVAYESQSPNAVDLARQWVAAYPNSSSWHDAIAIYRNLNHPDAATEFDLLRLARVTDALQGTGDYHAYAYQAADQANYGEAKSLMAEGITAGKIKASDPVVQEIQRVLKAKASPTEAELAAAEKGAREPNAFLRVGDRYYGGGNYAKAVELYREALQKGVDKDLANLRLGEALARTGDKAGAVAALNAVSGPRAEIAKFWLAYVSQRG
jgi:tetratricopeptide (TPR) repeat protein